MQRRTIYFFIISLWSFTCLAQDEDFIKKQKRKVKEKDYHAAYMLAKHYLKESQKDRKYDSKVLEYMQLAARHLYDSALFALGQMYEYGMVVDVDLKEALNLYNSAAYQNNGDALFALGLIYEEGKGVPKNNKQAAQYYLRAWEYGKVQKAYEKIKGFSDQELGDPKGLAYIHFQATQGKPQYEYLMANILEMGKQGAQQDIEKALEYYKKSAKQNNADALFMLARFYETGKYVDKNLRLAILYYLQSHMAGKQGIEAIVSEYNLVHLLGEKDSTLIHFQASQGNAASQFIMYQRYATQNKSQQALAFCQKAAAQNHIKAMMTMAQLYEEGRWVQQSKKNAFAWYHKAATLGWELAELKVSDSYFEGVGIEKDTTMALYWLLKAANQNFDIAEQKIQQFDLSKHLKNNYLEWVKWKAKKGEANDQLKLAIYYTKQKDARCLPLLESLEKRGNDTATELLAELYEKGFPEIKMRRDQSQALKYYKKVVGVNKELYKKITKIYSQPLPFLQDTIRWRLGIQAGNDYLKSTSKIDPKIYEYLGNLYFQKSDWQKSIEYFEKFIDQTTIFDLLSDALYKRVEGFLQLQKFDSVVWYSQEALEMVKEKGIYDNKMEKWRGKLYYQQAAAFFETESEIYKPCVFLRKAIKRKVIVEESYLERCSEVLKD